MSYRISDLEDGIYHDIPNDVYHARTLGVANKSALDQVDRSLKHYLSWANGREDKPTTAMLFGSACHMAILEPARFAEEYTVEEDFGDKRFKENKARFEEWKRQNGGKKLISPEDAENIGGMFEAVHAHPVVGNMIRNGVAEATIKWVDEGTGLVCKCRPDYYVADLKMAVDIKTTQDARPDSFARSVGDFRYHVQEAFYRDGFAALGETIEHFLFVAIEKTPPYAIKTYHLDQDALIEGAEQKDANMAALAHGIKTGEFPGYEDGIETLSLKPWHRRRSG